MKTPVVSIYSNNNNAFLLTIKNGNTVYGSSLRCTGPTGWKTIYVNECIILCIPTHSGRQLLYKPSVLIAKTQNEFKIESGPSEWVSGVWAEGQRSIANTSRIRLITRILWAEYRDDLIKSRRRRAFPQLRRDQYGR